MSAHRRAIASRGWGPLRPVVLAVVGAALVVSVTTVTTAAAAPEGRRDGVWVAAWSGSPEGLFPLMLPRGARSGTRSRQITLREVIHPSVGGTMLRVRITNVFGVEPLSVEAATVAVSARSGAIVDGTLQVARFHRRRAITLPAGGEVVSDPIRLGTKPPEDLAISIAVPSGTTSATQNLDPQQHNFAAWGSRTSQLTGKGFSASPAWSWISDVDVLRPSPAHAVVTLGDSLTSGTGSTIDANDRWPDVLARRLDQRPGNSTAVVNAGIAGNQLLRATSWSPSAISRFQRDVLSQTGARTVIVLEGVNDLNNGSAVMASALITGYRRIIAAAHQAGVRVIGGTILPFEGYALWSPIKEIERQRVNTWIRKGGAFDGVIDVANAVADPSDPRRIGPSFDSGDHLHLNNDGYAAIAFAVPLDGL